MTIANPAGSYGPQGTIGFQSPFATKGDQIVATLDATLAEQRKRRQQGQVAADRGMQLLPSSASLLFSTGASAALTPR